MLSREQVLERLTGYLEEMFEVPRAKVTLEARLFDELEVDSIDAVDLIVKLQDLTEQRIKPDEFKSVRTVGDVVDCIVRLLAVNESRGQ